MTFTPNSTGAPGITDAIAISAGAAHACALIQGGEVVCWGYNVHGEVGDGTTQRRLTAVAVHNLNDATAISVGGSQACALRRSGQVACWGGNDYGQLGDGTTDQRLTPVAVQGLTDATAISAALTQSCALRQAGDIACWGSPTGEVSTNQLIPKDLGFTHATAISTTYQHACTLFESAQAACWGYNSAGQLGNGVSSDGPMLTPGPVLDLDDATAISTGGAHSCALRRNAHVDCWGTNNWGQLGDSTTTSHFTPSSVLAVQ